MEDEAEVAEVEVDSEADLTIVAQLDTRALAGPFQAPQDPTDDDAEAVDVVCELIRMHGWRPIVRGGIEVARHFEGGLPSIGKVFGNLKREVFNGEKLSVGW